MKIATYLILVSSLLAGCASAGQAGADLNRAANTAAPAHTPAIVPAATLAPTQSEPRAGVPLVYYEWGHRLRLVDPASGEAIPGREPILISEEKEYAPVVALSPDGSRLAAVEEKGMTCVPYSGGSSCYPKATALLLIDVPSWQVITSTLPADGWVSQIVFDPRGNQLGISYSNAKGSSVMVFDSASGDVLGSQSLDFAPEGLSFFQGGEALVAYGTLPAEEPGISKPEGLRLEALSVPSMERLWQRNLPEITSGNWCLEGCEDQHGLQLYAGWVPAIVVSPQEEQLYILHADQEVLTRLSLSDGSSEDVKLQEAQSWLERLLSWTAGVAYAKGGMRGTTRHAVLSPDGKTLYVLSTSTDSELNQDGYYEITEMDTELMAVDTQRGSILDRRPASGYTLRLTPDGQYLLLEEWLESGMKTEVWSTSDLAQVTQLSGWEITRSMDADGEVVWLAKNDTNTTTEMALVDLNSWQVGDSWKVKGRALWIATR